MNTFTPETFKTFCENPIINMLMKLYGVTEDDVKNLAKEVEKPKEKVPETNVSTNQCKGDENPKDDVHTLTLEVSDDEVCSVLNKFEIETLLKTWRNVDSIITRLHDEFGIDFWSSYKNTTFYNQYNRIIRTFLELIVGQEKADDLEEWTFAESPCDFDEVWNKIFKN